MPSKKKKYNARFPAGRIKKIMQSDEDVGKVAQAVPIIISRTLELFVESLLTKTLKITNSRNAKTLSTSHMKQCIMSEQRFDFLRELVRNIPDISVAEEAANYQEEDNQSSPEEQYPDSDTPYDLSMPSTSLRAGAGRQQQQQHTASNGHNGGGHHSHHQQQQPHEYQRTYLKRSMSSNPSSVIRHTTAMAQTNVDCLPAKLARSDSTPVPQHHQQQFSTAASLATTTTQVQHPRLKHQSYSMPTHMENINNNNNNNNNNKPNTQTPLKTLRTPSQQTAIPAPIVNIDYSSKPVVKIDYSNLPLAGVTASANAVAAAPLSAPANIASSTFNFSADPVINIDLSNIVASPTSAVPSMATISIGTPPPNLPTPPKLTSSSSCASPSSSLTSSSLSSSSQINKTKSSSAKTAVIEQQSRNSKAAMAEPFNSTSTTTTKATALAAAVAAATTMTTTISTSKSDSYLDMDEDYDNI